MAGIIPDEGEELVTKMVVRNITTDRGTDLDLVAITNVTISESTTAATLTRPTGASYADITLDDATWSDTGSSTTYPIQTFTAGSGGYIDAITGYAIITKGATPRIISMELDPSGPYTLVETDTYKITPTITTL
jgi:hypothetical protein